MAVLALGLYGVYLVLALGLRSAVQKHRTGSTGFREISGRVGSGEWTGGVLFVVALAAGIVGPLLDLADVVEPVRVLDRAGLALIGVVVGVAGIVATVLAQLAMGNAWRIGVDERERTDLVTAGPFQLVRNPIFTAMACTAIGLGLLVPNVVSLLGIVALIVALEVQVRLVEEPYLARVHGRGYHEYAARTGRFLPGVGRGP